MHHAIDEMKDWTTIQSWRGNIFYVRNGPLRIYDDPTERMKQTLHSPLSMLLKEHNTFCLRTPHHHVYASRSRSLTYVCLIRTSEFACMIPGIIGGLFFFSLAMNDFPFSFLFLDTPLFFLSSRSCLFCCVDSLNTLNTVYLYFAYWNTTFEFFSVAWRFSLRRVDIWTFAFVSSFGVEFCTSVVLLRLLWRRSLFAWPLMVW